MTYFLHFTPFRSERKPVHVDSMTRLREHNPWHGVVLQTSSSASSPLKMIKIRKTMTADGVETRKDRRLLKEKEDVNVWKHWRTKSGGRSTSSSTPTSATSATRSRTFGPIGPFTPRTRMGDGPDLALESFPTSVKWSEQDQHIFSGREHRRFGSSTTTISEKQKYIFAAKK